MSDDNHDGNNADIKPSEYVKDLLIEKHGLTPEQHPYAMRLLDQEVTKAQAQAQGGKIPKPETRYVDIYKEKPIKVTAKVLVPVKEHPRFNFVGKLLGPKGNSLKRLQEDTMTKMAILGRGSMKDKAKEEELRMSLDPKYAHLSDELHIEIQALAPPAEAYARVAYALAEIRKYLVPDLNDDIRQEQLREIQQYSGVIRGGRGGASPSAPRGAGGGGRSGLPVRGGASRGPPMIAAARAPVAIQQPPVVAASMPRSMSGGKTKVFSILDRARVAMEESYAGYEEPTFYDSAAIGYEQTGYASAYNGAGAYYEGGYATGDASASGSWKTFGSGGDGGGGGGKAPSGGAGRYGNTRQSGPYSRPQK